MATAETAPLSSCLCGAAAVQRHRGDAPHAEGDGGDDDSDSAGQEGVVNIGPLCARRCHDDAPRAACGPGAAVPAMLGVRAWPTARCGFFGDRRAQQRR